jgi:hypothetical protein
MRSISGPEIRIWQSPAQRSIAAAAAGEAGLKGIAAAAGIHRRNQHEARRVGDAMIGAGDRDRAILERLAQRVEHARLELGQFVEEQHAMMGKRDLAGSCTDAAAGEGRHARRMMRAAERPLRGEGAALDLAGGGSDHGNFRNGASLAAHPKIYKK